MLLSDQLTKIWAVESLAGNSPTEVFGRFFMFTLVYNEGGAMGTNFGSSTYYLISSIFILMFVFYYIYANRNKAFFAYPMAFIAGGAIGNIIDRIRLGRVIDFLDFDFFDIRIGDYLIERWWTFNIADAAITCSIIYLVIYMLFFHKSHKDINPAQPVTE